MIHPLRQHLTYLLSALSLVVALSGATFVCSQASSSRIRNWRQGRTGQSRLADHIRDFDPHPEIAAHSSPYSVEHNNERGATGDQTNLPDDAALTAVLPCPPFTGSLLPTQNTCGSRVHGPDRVHSGRSPPLS
jgi:hypothetical protein